LAENTIKAQMPGTFYRRPDPESDPFVEEGEEVSAGDTVGLIEVMKNFSEVKMKDRKRPFSGSARSRYRPSSTRMKKPWVRSCAWSGG